MDLRIFWLALGTFAIGVEGFVIGSMLPLIAADTGTTIPQAGILAFTYSLSYAIGAPVLAALFGAFDRRLMLVLATLVFVIGEVLMATAQGFAMLVVARVVIAVGSGFYAATAQATAVSLATVEQRGRAISIVLFGTTAAVAFGAPLGALIGSHFGWRTTYVTIAVIGFAASMAIALMLPSGLRGESRTLRERLSVIAIPGVFPALLAMTFYVGGALMLVTYIGPLTTDMMGLSLTLLPALLFAYGLGAAIGNLGGGWLADRIGAQRAVTWSMAAATVMVALLPAIGVLPDVVKLGGFFLFLFARGLTGWSFLPGQSSRLIVLAPDAVPLVLALNAAALSLGGAVAAFFGARTLELVGVWNLAWVAGFLSLMSLLLVVFGRPRAVR